MLRVLDWETTGFPPEADVIEVGFTDVYKVKNAFSEQEEWNWTPQTPGGFFCDSHRPIEIEAMATHHITKDNIKRCLTFKSIEKDLLAGNPEAFVAHNADFELQFVCDELKAKPWICTLKCAYMLFPEAPSFKNQVLRYYLKVDDDPFFMPANSLPAHRAGPDTYVTAFVLKKMLEKASVEQLVEWSSKPALLPKIMFGKHRGTAWKDLPSSYVAWLFRQSDLDPNVKHTLKHHFG